MTALEILESFATAATARDLLDNRAYQAGLATLIAELTPEATP